MFSEGLVIALKKPVIGPGPPVGKIVRNGEEISRRLRADAANDSLVDDKAKAEDLVVETRRGERAIEVDGALPEERHHDNVGAVLANRGERVSQVIIGAHREEGFADESPALPAQQLPQRLSRDARPDIIVADEVEPFREFLFAEPNRAGPSSSASVLPIATVEGPQAIPSYCGV
jgi:hypothetical protein